MSVFLNDLEVSPLAVIVYAEDSLHTFPVTEKYGVEIKTGAAVLSFSRDPLRPETMIPWTRIRAIRFLWDAIGDPTPQPEEATVPVAAH